MHLDNATTAKRDGGLHHRAQHSIRALAPNVVTCKAVGLLAYYQCRWEGLRQQQRASNATDDNHEQGREERATLWRLNTAIYPFYATTFGVGRPYKTATRFSAARVAIRTRVATLALPICGVSTTFGKVSSG